MTTTDFDALIAAVHAHPDEDTPRLMLADLLDESGTDPARAELIRVQVALRQRGSPAPNDDRTFELAHRENDLVRDNRDRWLAGPRCPVCNGRGKLKLVGRFENFLDPACQACHGSGDAGGLTWELPGYFRADETAVVIPRPQVEFVRGFERVTMPRLADCVADCPDCNDGRWGNGRDGICRTCDGEAVPSPWLAAVVRHHPYVEAVVPLDREPYSADTEYVRQWWWPGESRHGNQPWDVPDAIRPKGAFETRGAAVTALGPALVRWARG